jgi:cbb3-type cytochrome c oxidase subunit III
MVISKSLALSLFMLAGFAVQAQPLHEDAQKYAYCTVCHGAAGGGNAAVGAPNIAVLDDWYVQHQLQGYRAGWRGTHVEDDTGTEMKAVVRILDAAEIDAIVDYVASFDAKPARATIVGDAARGADLYTSCLACHGDAAQGNAALNAPRLAGQSDWYLVAQLAAYKDGWRGTHPDDGLGQQMRPMVQTLSGDNDLRDVVAYINTLNRGEQ